MQQKTTYNLLEVDSKLNKIELWVGIVVLAIGLSVFQDYVYSQVQNTGFYISESLLYNSIWAFLAPLALLQIRLLKRFKFKSTFKKIGVSIALSGMLTLTHIFIFASFFVCVSYFAFSPTHRFSGIFNTALSNQFYMLVLAYTFISFVSQMVKKRNQHEPSSIEYLKSINVKLGLKTISLKTEAIERISTEKPYTVIVSGGKKYLDNRSLKDFATLLNYQHFVRVHRSVIINKSFVKEMKSRKNGDYDALLESGQTIRVSRHYRANWQDLLQ